MILRENWTEPNQIKSQIQFEKTEPNCNHFTSTKPNWVSGSVHYILFLLWVAEDGYITPTKPNWFSGLVHYTLFLCELQKMDKFPVSNRSLNQRHWKFGQWDAVFTVWFTNNITTSLVILEVVWFGSVHGWVWF